jgi:hypothetical protein
VSVVGYWNLSTTFLGFSEVQMDNQTVTLSDTDQTVVDIEIDAPPTGAEPDSVLSPLALAISGSFMVADPDTGNVTDVGALVAQNVTQAVSPNKWNIRLIFPAQPSSVDVIVKAWGIFAMFGGGTVGSV